MDKSLAQRIHDILATRQEEITNFPEAGDDLKVSLRNSQYDLFPVEYAQEIKDSYPSIYRAGGNIRGSAQFNILAPIARRGGNTETLAEENAVRRREAWAARHLRDHSLAGVVAQMKWLVIGSRGLDHMKAVIQEAKDKLEGKSERLDPNPCWDGYVAYGLQADGSPNCVPEKTAEKIEKLLNRDC